MRACIIWLCGAQEIHMLHSTHYEQTGMVISFSTCKNKCAWHNSSKFVQYYLHTHIHTHTHTHIKKWHNMKNVREFLAQLQWHLVVRLCTVPKWNQWRRVNQFSSSSRSSLLHTSPSHSDIAGIHQLALFIVGTSDHNTTYLQLD